MNTASLKKFATEARNKLISQITAKLTYVLKEETAELKTKKYQIGKLREEIGMTSQQQVIETTAYTWFNRFIALRFMDVNGYTSPRVLTPDEGHTVPAILQGAKSGVFTDELQVNRERVMGLLDGKIQHPNPQAEAFRMLIVASCNAYGTMMPFLFETIEDWTELLIPDDLLSDNSIIADVRGGMSAEDCVQEEVIGWLYQYYIAEKKDQVFEGLKKNQKITPENIPAATQLFTPHWIVRYLVENTLGKLWLQLKPGSELRAHMPYYIEQEPAGPLPESIKSITDITFLDPCTGSGHILVYAFELLCRMYEEEGYDTHEIPSLILQYNLFGLEIDDRAAALAGFALCMKSRSVDKRFFKRGVLPNIRAFKNITFEKGEIEQYMSRVGIDVFTADVAANIAMLSQAKNFGSLIQPVPLVISTVKQAMGRADVAGDAFLAETHTKVVDGLDIIERLQRKYACVVTNPPYMGAKGMNDSLSKYAAKAYPDSKSDLFALFIEKIIMMVHTNGLIGLMTPFTWMFLSSYEKLRNHIHNCSTITSLIRPEYHAFFDSAYVPICSFTLFKKSNKNYQGVFIDLQKFYGAGMQPIKTLEAINNPNCGWLYQASSEDFAKIPGSPIVYWVSTKIIKIIGDTTKIGDVVEARQGLATADNNRFLRLWWEIPLKNCYHNAVSRVSAKNSERRWFPYNKGGVFRKWYGNHEFLVDWEDDGKRLNEFKPRAVIRNPNYYFLESISWSDVTIGTNSFRYYPSGFIFDSTGHSAFPNKEATKEQLLSLLNNKLTNFLIGVLNPTMHFHVGYFNSLPYAKLNNLGIESLINSCIDFTKFDWDSYETSWDFTELPIISGQWLVASDQRDKRDQSAKHSLLQNAYQHLREHWQQMIDETKRLEEENNRIFIEAYGLQEELTPEVPIQEITLTCNPAYRYGAGKTEEEYATLQKADTVRELLSYCAGVLFGRYSLDKPGLILANQGECTNDCITKVYGENVPPPSDALLPDEDAIIPILDEDYFGDDIFNRTKQILAKAFSPETLAENIKFIEDALGKDLRKFYTKDFYNDHIKRYKKRPIYWMFASPKGTFRTLIYMHRYRPDTLSQMLSNYLRPLIEKLKEEQVMCNREMVSETAAAADKTRSQKRLDKLVPQIEELTEYEQVLYRLAAKRIEIDLDDGVRVNYPKFAPAIVTIKGMEVEE